CSGNVNSGRRAGPFWRHAPTAALPDTNRGREAIAGSISLPARNAAHVRQMVGDTLVAVDAGLLTAEKKALVGDGGTRRLLGDVHGLRGVAVAAFQGIIGLESRPFVQRELQPLVEEFFARVDVAEQLAPDLLRRLHLARDLVGPVVRHVAVRTCRTYAGTVGEVNGRF